MKEFVEIQHFTSLIELVQYFKDEKQCIHYLEHYRWRGSICCPRCGVVKVYRFKDGTRFKCSGCREQFTAKTGTIFEDTKIPLSKWFIAIYFVVCCKKGVSSHQLARDLNITQKSAWFVLQRIRGGFQQDYDTPLEEMVEVDETFVGGKNKNRHKDKKVKNSQGRSFKDKTPVLGVLQRDGKIKTIVVPDTKGSTIQPIIRKWVKPGSMLMTDEWHAYQGLNEDYAHFVVDHGRGQYASGIAYTNNVEGFWSWVKRAIIGVWHNVSKKHLQKYIDEVTYRYNTRLMNQGIRINNFMGNINIRIKYKTLIA